ncbi:MAG: tetratricopeptide repeat protein [Candidatus Sericytochromatia bacterium]|nr:tetratricopeptide repeat protein [Candidatus Sericytochromatia bacterium]
MTDDQTAALAEATTYFRNDALADALTLVDVLLAETPTWSEAMLLRGKILFESNRKIEAAHTLRQVVTLDPQNAEAFYALGLTFRHLRRLDDAEGCLKAALRRQPDDDDARFVLANVLFDKQDLAGAVAEYTALAGRRPLDADLQYNLARAADDAGPLAVAAEAYDTYLRLTSGTDDATRQFATERLAQIRSGTVQPLDWADPHDADGAGA